MICGAGRSMYSSSAVRMRSASVMALKRNVHSLCMLSHRREYSRQRARRLSKKGEAMGKVLGAVALAIALCAAANIDAWFLIVLFWMAVAWWCMTD